MAEQNITMKQKNSRGSYDTLYPATTVNQLSGVLPESKGGTGATSLSAMLTAAGGARIQAGSYIGTGTYGPSNPNSLTFDFSCQLFALFTGKKGQIPQWNTSDIYPFLNPNLAPQDDYALFLSSKIGTSVYSSKWYFKHVANKEISWYCTTYTYNSVQSRYEVGDASKLQWNSSGIEYYYLLLGV